MEEQREKRTLGSKFRSFIVQSKRVFKLTRKPTKTEFRMIVKVTGIGIGIIGAIGFLVHFGWAMIR
jgi:protein transport protein SEC61 subunit gamma-like protein